MQLIRGRCLVIVLSLAWATAQSAGTIDYPGLGAVAVVQPAGTPAQFVIFLSGDGGWSKGVADMARHLAGAGALVAGVDIAQMQRRQDDSHETCIRAAEILEGLSHFVQQKFRMQQYALPILVGYSSGATLAFTTLVQAPRGTFKGALSLGFCPDLEWRKPLCRGQSMESVAAERGFVYRPARELRAPWIALQGERDQVCPATGTRNFVAQVDGAELVALPNVGHGYSVERNWLPQFIGAYKKIAAMDVATTTTLPQDVGDLPLIELPPAHAGRDTLAVLLSGDGGWAGLDKELAAQLNARGVPVVGWDSLRYFWHARTPDGAARDLDRVIQHYARAWGRSRVLLIGYSQGADVLPFMVNRLPAATRNLVVNAVLIGVGDAAYFEFSVSHWLGKPAGGLPIAPEIERGKMGHVVCIYGADDKESSCRELHADGLRGIELPGGHHFAGDYARVAAAVLEGSRP